MELKDIIGSVFQYGRYCYNGCIVYMGIYSG